MPSRSLPTAKACRPDKAITRAASRSMRPPARRVTAPGSLSADEVYALCAYILGEAKIIDKTAVLDAQTLPRVEMPNRDGFISDPRPEIFK